MDLQRLQTFRTVATLMNFNQAAEVLHYSQSTVSAQVKTLENEIGVLLFKRIGKSIQLTEAGAKMLVYADKLLAIKDEAVAEVTGRNMVSGLLTIRMPQTVAAHYLPGILCDYQPRFPGMRLDTPVAPCIPWSMNFGSARSISLFCLPIPSGRKILQVNYYASSPSQLSRTRAIR
jgi:DNA-binding transcriptional LysR family regulator